MPKRYYRKLRTLPEDADRLEPEVRLPVSEEQLERFLGKDFHSGNMKQAVGYLILRYGLWEEAMNIGRNAKRQTAFRATWALEWAYEQSGGELPEWFVDRMLDDFIASANGSLHRVYAKMLCDLVRFGGFVPTAAQAERLAEKCFDLLIDKKTRVAVQFWCMDILGELAPRMEWIPDALKGLIDRISSDPGCTPGMSVACREIGKRLKIINRS